MREYGPMHVVQIIGVYHWLRKLRMHLSSDFRQRGKGDIKLYMPLHPEMHTVKSMVDLKTARWNKIYVASFFYLFRR
jgi:hypothetical protein